MCNRVSSANAILFTKTRVAKKHTYDLPGCKKTYGKTCDLENLLFEYVNVACFSFFLNIPRSPRRVIVFTERFVTPGKKVLMTVFLFEWHFPNPFQVALLITEENSICCIDIYDFRSTCASGEGKLGKSQNRLISECQYCFLFCLKEICGWSHTEHRCISVGPLLSPGSSYSSFDYYWISWLHLTHVLRPWFPRAVQFARIWEVLFAKVHSANRAY
jgi:hypothetical protein